MNKNCLDEIKKVLPKDIHSERSDFSQQMSQILIDYDSTWELEKQNHWEIIWFLELIGAKKDQIAKIDQ